MSIEKSALHIAALEYVAKGRRVIPIVPDGKTPMLKKWHENAFTTPEAVDAHWTEHPESNIAFCPEDEGLAIVEQDPGGDVGPLNLPATYEVQSPRGGIHYYFVGSVPPSASKLAPHVDTRGRSSYVLIPPSVVNGKHYRVHNDRDIVALPAAIETRLAPSVDASGSDVSTLDLHGNIVAARTLLRDHVRRGSVAIEGRGGDNLTYQVSCKLVRDYALSVDRALELMEAEFNPHCQPPWTTEELKAKLEHAQAYGQNAPGAYASAPAAVVFANAPLDQVALDKPQQQGQPRGRFLFKTAEQMANSPDPEWIIPELIPASSVVLFTGPKGNFKSFLALDVGLGIASGQSTFGATPLKTGPVFYGAWEGLQLLEKVHRAAWLKERGLDPLDGAVPFHMASGPLVGVPEEVDAFGDAIQDALDWYHPGQTPQLIILDTYSKCMMGMDENDPTHANGFVRVCMSFIDKWPGCSVLVLAHTGKDTAKGTRGSSAFEAGVDTVIDISRVERSTLVKAHVRHMRAGPERVSPFSMKGREAHDSLVFDYLQPIEAQALQAMTDPLDARRVANVLRQISAVSEGNAVSTSALATSLTDMKEGEREEGYRSRVAMTEKVLRTLGRHNGPLKRLTIQGHTLRWYVPDLAEVADEKKEGEEGGNK